MKTVLSGNTIRVSTVFYDLNDLPTVADEVTLTIFDGRWQELAAGVLHPDENLKYNHDYIIPGNATGPLYIEVEGVINGYPTLERRAIGITKVRDENICR